MAPPDFTVFWDLKDSEVVTVTPKLASPDCTIFSNFEENEEVSVTPKPFKLVDAPDVHGSVVLWFMVLREKRLKMYNLFKLDLVAAAAKNKEAAITEHVIDITNILEAFVRSEKYEVVPNNLEDVIATEPAADIID